MATNQLFAFDWQPDEAARQERGVLYDEEISGRFLRENRVALTSETIVCHPGPAGRKLLELSLSCLTQPQAENRFDWFRLVVNFQQSPGVIIRDLVPREVHGAEPVKQTIKYGGGLTFEVGSLKLGPSATYEKAEESSVYYPEVTGMGQHTTAASWVFAAAAGVRFERTLKLLLEAPADLPALHTRFIARGRVRHDSLLGQLPLLARREFTFDLSEAQTLGC